jgi:transposase, IS6 family
LVVNQNGVKITQAGNCWHSLCRERRSPHSWAAGTPCALKQERKLGRRCRCRTCPYLNNVVEQDHRGINLWVNASQGFRSFDGAWRTIQGYEVLHMIRKGQVMCLPKGDVLGQMQFIREILGLKAE